MRSIAIGVLGIVLIHGGAAAQTVEERAQVLRDFQQTVADYTQRHQCVDLCSGCAAATTPAPKIFTLPVAMVFRQVIAKALDERAPAMAMSGVGDMLPLRHHPVVFEPFPTTELHAFPPVLLNALPPLPPQLEYRLIGHDLVLRDLEGDLIVAVLREALGHVATTTKH